MATPKSLVFQLHKHWDTIETLVRAGREMPAFSEDQVIAAIVRHPTASSTETEEAILRALCNADVLQRLSRTGHFQINPLVLEFVRGLTREHELGLSSVLQARVEAIRSATKQLRDGLAAGDMDEIRRAAVKLMDWFRQISQQLDQDRHAILELAEQARSADSSMPGARRYRAVLEAYEQHVEPMNEMMDTGLSGHFYRYLEAAEQALDDACEKLTVQGVLYSHRTQLRQVAYQAKELRRLGKVVARQCADTLLPLREEVRHHNALSTAVSTLLGQVRKRGLHRSLGHCTETTVLPLWRAGRSRRISVGDEVMTIMAEACSFVPVVRAFPEELETDPANHTEWVDEAMLRNRLADDLPVDNLLTWLQAHYGQLPDRVILRLYHELACGTRWRSRLQSTETTTDLQQIRVRYFPHSLSVHD